MTFYYYMIFFVLYFSSLLLFVKPDTSVHILSEQYGNGQLITSSTLNWIPDLRYSASKEFVIGGFEIIEYSSEGSLQIKKRPIFVCRAMHNGIWVAGGQKEGDKRCTVTLTGNVRSYERYQLLENVENAARVSWNDWTKFYRPPFGSVATDKLYVARHIINQTAHNGERPFQTHYIGTLSSQDTLGTITYVKEDGNEGSAEFGQLLVETEPISYELNTVVLNNMKQQIVKKKLQILGEATIKNEGSTPVVMAEAFVNIYLYTLYWGQGHAMLKGLNTSVILQNKTRLSDTKWGIDIKENRTNVYTVEVYLQPGTAVNVTLRGYYTDVEVPYSGKLLSHYKDNASTDPRMINGVRREESIVDITPEFGSVYYFHNYNLIPTTVTFLSNESTTSKMLIMTNHQQQTNRLDLANNNPERQLKKENAVIDMNEILNSVTQHEVANIQGDDGVPLSLKNKSEQSMATNTRVSRFVLLGITMLTSMLSLLLNRVT
ncbi:PREDICTED: protein unzipped [Ceratosolen solmsi marchali]|uniref:Protein unzipped n=1 Tax=Ceratosolen solmsi marchali TaxID=326594 RepID=A0AAJ6YQU4_9HYME|nr:PREDICTED: protein unzipped [Ceratosolen solmsi marchali]